MVLGSGVNVVVGAFGSSVVDVRTRRWWWSYWWPSPSSLPTSLTIPIQGKRAERDQEQVHPVALALLGACLAGKFLQALLAIGLLTFTLRGSHEHVRLAGDLPNNAGTDQRGALLKSPCPRADSKLSRRTLTATPTTKRERSNESTGAQNWTRVDVSRSAVDRRIPGLAHGDLAQPASRLAGGTGDRRRDRRVPRLRHVDVGPVAWSA